MSAGPAGRTAVVTGASRGFGRGIAAALAATGVHVVGVARGAEALGTLHDELGDRFTPVRGDVADPHLAADVVGRYRPEVLVLNAGASPAMGPVHALTWEDFSRPWEVDVRQAVEWAGAALRLPLAPGSTVVLLSSGAALRGSPASGGYAGAKATVRFVGAYSAEESARAGLGIDVVTLLPQLTPVTGVGGAGAAAYAERGGTDLDTFTANLEPWVTPELVGQVVVDLLGQDRPRLVEYAVDGHGARPVPR